jgi:hypothetical protein
VAVDVQTVLVCLTAAAAAAYLARGAWRTWASKGCQSGCGGCGSPAAHKSGADLIPAEDLLARVRGGDDAAGRREPLSTDRGKSGTFSA